MKKCKKCNNIKELSQYSPFKYSKDRLQYICKPCRSILQKERMMKNPLLKKESHLKHLYGITLEIYNIMLDSQNNCCKICNNPNKTKYLCVDHCHKTGKIRGLLCDNCNKALGHLKDNIKTAENIIKYLKDNL